VVPVLAERFRLVCPDNRGSGQTKSSGSFSVRVLAADAAALLDHLRLDRAHVAGHSMGGQIAQEMAVDNPGRVRSLALISTSAQSSARLSEVVETAARMVTSAPPDVCCRAFLPWMFSEEFFETPGAMDAEVSRVMSNPHPPSPEGLAAQSAAIGAFDALDRVAAVRCPTLVLAGAEDALVPPAHARDLAGRIRGSKLVVLERGGHDLIHELPDEVSGAMLPFLSSLAAASK
jgi:pimeloyl-ACP methyl ester carboxylesterase